MQEAGPESRLRRTRLFPEFAGASECFGCSGRIWLGGPEGTSLVGNEIEPENSAGLAPASNAPASAVPAPSGDGDLDLDMLSASLRADASDTDSFFKVLADKLAEALGERVRIKREGGLFKKDKAAVGITIDLATGAGVVLEANRRGSAIECTVSRPVRGIVISSKPCSVPEWLDSLTKALAEEARHSQQTWAALHGMLA